MALIRAGRCALPVAVAAVALAVAGCTTPGQSITPGTVIIASSATGATPAPASSAAPSGPATQPGGTAAAPTTVAPTTVATSPASPASAPSTITVTITPGSIDQIVDHCPFPQSEWNLSGRISSNRAVTVTYQWVRSDGTSTQPTTITVGPGADASLAYVAYEPGSTSDYVPSTTTYSFTETLRVTSPVRVSASAPVSYTCRNPPLVLVGEPVGTPPSSPLTTPVMGQPFIMRVAVSGGDGTYHWSATGLPSSVSIDPSTGVISGTFPVYEDGDVVSYLVIVTITDGESPPQVGTLKIPIFPVSA